MNLLVFGATGQVAKELHRLAPQAKFLGRESADLLDPTSCVTAIRTHRPDRVINAAAWTAVDRAETEEETATLVNGRSPTAMAEECALRKIPFVHISTDYVFDGTGSNPYRRDDIPSPLSAYGRSKLVGETGILSAAGTSVILRTSWVFSAHGANFLKTMIRLGREREQLNVVADQVGGPTPARDVAAACLTISERLMAEPAKAGIYHYSGAPDVSWADFARAIMQQARLSCQIADIPTSAYPTPARRPANSRLDCSGLSDFDLSRPDWQSGVATVLKELGAIE